MYTVLIYRDTEESDSTPGLNPTVYPGLCESQDVSYFVAKVGRAGAEGTRDRGNITP